ncbi:thioredoxin family protein [Dokdonia ponticola]|uniref:Thioredoxin family protein n=1 Tax=Dokdonia ponticola TaxID=2041041 RepID=A0ABV9HVE8_9FLAO
MKKILPILLLFLATYTTVQSQEWNTNFAAAQKRATKEHKTIILVFQGSDWCAPCIKLDRAIWSTETFKKYAKDHFVMVQADFPRKKKNELPAALKAHNEKLADTYNKQGIFPFVVVMTPEGKVLGQATYQKATPEEYIKMLTDFEG